MDHIVSVLVAGLFKFLALLPLRLLRRVGILIGDLAWILNTGARRVTEENVRICFPALSAERRRRLARDSLRHLGMMALELGLVWQGDAADVMRHVCRVVGREHMDAALAGGRGVIVLAPHIGNWEVLGLFLGENFTVTSMFQPPDNPALDRIIRRARMRNGATLVPTNTSGVKALLRVLKRGEVVATLPDQVPPPNSGGFAPLFGIPALTPTLCYNLISRTGARAVMAYARRIPASVDFEIVFLPVPETLYSKDEQVSLTALNQGVEATVNDVPEQYQWEYKRFRKQPGGERKYYLKSR